MKEYTFSTNWVKLHKDVWTKHLSHLKHKKNLKYLEVGVYEGRSLIWFLENILTHESSCAYAVDLFPDDRLKTFKRNINQSNNAHRVQTFKGLSSDQLKRIKDKFDVIYIDSSHETHHVLEDVVLAWPLLKDGGILILDDYRWREKTFPSHLTPKPAIDFFLKFYNPQLRVLHHFFQAIVQKKIHEIPYIDGTYATKIYDYTLHWNCIKSRGANSELFDSKGKKVELPDDLIIKLQKLIIDIYKKDKIILPEVFKQDADKVRGFLEKN